MNELLNEFRHALSEGGDTGMLITADRMDEQSATEGDQYSRFAELLRKYVDIQTYFRMGQTPNTALAKRYDELNKSFQTKPTLAIHGATYSKPFGPIYTALEIDQTTLVSRLDMLAEQPVRELSIRYATPNNDLAAILRNYRVESMFQLKLQMSHSYGQERLNLANRTAQCIKDLSAPMLMRLSISGVMDTKKHLQLFFQMSKVNKGCELWVSQASYSEPVHVTTKRL